MLKIPSGFNVGRNNDWNSHHPLRGVMLVANLHEQNPGVG
jgi:hypothetical protein